MLQTDDKPYQALASAVLLAAYRDMQIPLHRTKCASWSGNALARDSAVAFLTQPSARLAFWCALAGFNPEAVMHGARRALKRLASAA